MSNPFSGLFIFTKTERNGILGLILLIIAVLACRYGFDAFSDTQSYDYSEFQTQLASLVAHQDSLALNKPVYKDYSNRKSTSSDKKEAGFNSKPKYVIEPNTANLADWQQLGFSPKQAASIIKYRNAGAVFREKKDLLRLFMVDEQKLGEIDAFINIDQSKFPTKAKSTYTKEKWKDAKKEYPKKNYKTFKKKAVILPSSVPINSSDTARLKTIHGIGSYYAKSIVKFREMTGGFHSQNQFSEIYGVKDDPEAIDSLRKYVIIDNQEIIKININKCTQKELSKHYYIKWNVAKAIISYREMHGDYENVDDIGQSHLVTPELVSKIAPYLKLNDD